MPRQRRACLQQTMHEDPSSLTTLVIVGGMLLVELVVLHGEELTHHLLLVVDGDVTLRPDTGQLKRALVTELA